MELSPRVLVSSNETRVGSRVSFTCPDGLSIVGATSITCLHTGEWDNPPPGCQHLNCPDIFSVVKVQNLCLFAMVLLTLTWPELKLLVTLT